MDDTCRIRLWAEQRRDGGFWEAERDHSRRHMPINLLNGRPPPRATTQESFAGIRLACMSDMPPWDMQRSLIWAAESAGLGPSEGEDGEDAQQGETAETAPVAAGAVDTELEQAVAVVLGEGNAVGATGVAAGSSLGSHRNSRHEKRILVFLKGLGLETPSRRSCNVGDGNIGGSGNGVEEKCVGAVATPVPVYLTHAVLRQKSPLRALFELVADRLNDGTLPDELGAYVEDLPCMWQDSSEDLVDGSGPVSQRVLLWGGGGGSLFPTVANITDFLVLVLLRLEASQWRDSSISLAHQARKRFRSVYHLVRGRATRWPSERGGLYW